MGTNLQEFTTEMGRQPERIRSYVRTNTDIKHTKLAAMDKHTGSLSADLVLLATPLRG